MSNYLKMYTYMGTLEVGLVLCLVKVVGFYKGVEGGQVVRAGAVH